MNFVKLSTSHEYLYSPKSWLHNQNIALKMVIMVTHLILLPFAPLKSLLLFFLPLLTLYKSMNLPHDIKKYFYTTFAASSLFLLLSIQRNDMYQSNQPGTRQMIHLYIPNSYRAIDMLLNKRMNLTCLYLPLSTVRFISLHLIYLILVRYLLITTSHESITRTALIKYGQRKYFSIKFIFVTVMSSYFIKNFFQQIKAVKISYILRSADSNTMNAARVILLIHLPYLRQFLAKTNARIYTIASTLYSRNIQCAGLNIYK